MKKLIVVASALFLVAGLSGCGASGDSLMQDQIKLTNALADAIEKGDKTKVEDTKKRLEETKKKFDALKLSDEEKNRLAEKYQGDAQKAAQRVGEALIKSTLGDFKAGNIPGLGGDAPPK